MSPATAISWTSWSVHISFPMPYLSGSNVGLMRWLYTRLARRRRKPTIQEEGKDDNERAAEEQLVAELLELGARGGQDIYGVAETLRAVWQGRVRTLVVAEGLHLPGAECLRCGCLVPDGQRLCPTCGAPLAALDDVVERASARWTSGDAWRPSTDERPHGWRRQGADWAPYCGFG